MILRLLVLLFVVACAGCVPNMGASDVELTYELDPSAAPAEDAPFAEDLRALVLRRLAAGHVSADVYEEDRHVRVVVDESMAASVDDLLTWSGTIVLFEADPDAGAGLDAEGSHKEIRAALLTIHPPDDARVLAEPLWDHDTEIHPQRWRTRFVHSTPVGELGDGTLVAWGEAGTLRLHAPSSSAAAEVIALARTRAREVVAARGHTSLGVVTFDDDAVVLSFGRGFEAYSRAQEQMLLLTTPRLPPLHRAGAMGLPPNTALAAACVVIPFLLSLAWLAFVRRFDRAHPEPIWLVLVTFVLGAFSTIPAAFVEWGLSRLTPVLDPRLAALGGRAFALPFSFVIFTLTVGLVEEGAKMGAAMFAARRREFDEPVDGILYGIVASLGFAAAENVQFFAVGRLALPLVIARAFMSIPAHMFFGAIWGYALGARLVDPRRHRLAWLLVAAALHGLFDALLSVDGGGALAVGLNVSLASVFVGLVQKALRHGVVEEAARAVKPEERLLFRVGRPGLFWVSAVALHVLAFGIFMLGAWYQLARHRPSTGFVVGSSLLVLLLAGAAFGISATLPLDVAVDAYGVTFAGAARPWRKIRGFSDKGDHVELDCEGGPIELGPAARDVIGALILALRTHLGGAPGERVVTLESR